ncbi:DUF1761 domain-containing protein [Pelagerythrobacter marensis]|uniref:DUF1761 domain-containing protein n=1 Tax=Pelagerythrobacter marensis TaxID=543877 RepID=A0A0G3X580_9SPHN|nr:DUF1761 domain-containing protein [Pelagerythrobacter marensis]AKM06357.1 hypothetical protein AM2010_268 [Pelagerythrobacter marensis]
MGPVNWIAVILATLAAGLLALGWFGPIFGMAKAREVAAGKIAVRRRPERVVAITGGLLFLSAAMMGHMFARVGGATLEGKPWLFFMMSGGLAGAFVIPALLISYSHIQVPTRVALIDAGYWLAAYLAMGGVFWLLG